jgi:hypothetical protein
MGVGDEALWQGAMGKLKKTPDRRARKQDDPANYFRSQRCRIFRRPTERSLEKFANSEDLEGYNHTTFGGYYSLRPALYSSGDGQAIFRNFRYRKLSTK